ncbi:pentatricopeptide repeat domain-containing protein [Drechmeria coniospora]|uniref:Pentatricopeptide repeat domain-containing protein n=1 Tax=Drechmeria coniospora TaxID=98403 RepID=A0A151GRH5_DRECN|nr:pentatricopeptide repeat domain-containing protein [Drechmeria coniospora]KYK59717.1 pentatricopeptide repeat domain-containing protein [Drechmeria coniospora]
MLSRAARPASKLATQPVAIIRCGLRFTALAHLSVSAIVPTGRIRYFYTSPQRHPKTLSISRLPLRRNTASWGWRTDGRLGQSLAQSRAASTRTITVERPLEDTDLLLERAGVDVESYFGNVKHWERLLATLHLNDEYDNIWAGVEAMRAKGLIHLFAEPGADVLRDVVVTTALRNDEHIATLVNIAAELLEDRAFRWPDLYMRIVHLCLEHSRFEDAVHWHLQLATYFPPSTEEFGALLSGFVVNPTPQMQSSLTTLYTFSTERGLYDCIIPALFASGQSKIARTWRKKLILFKDFPIGTKSRPFLTFLARYYPSVPLTTEELEAAGIGHPTGRVRYDEQISEAPTTATGHPTGQYSDSLMAKWFASSWASVDFAINLVHRIGVQAIGPRSFQSLALREQDAEGFACRIEQLQRLGIQSSPHIYCKVLVLFARHGEDVLLHDLVNCDIHPDEFENPETRQVLLAAAVATGDRRRETLLRGIEKVIETDPSSGRLNSLLACELPKRKMGKSMQVLERMEALKVNLAQDSAAQLLKRAFRSLRMHPVVRKSTKQRLRNDAESPLNRAIDYTRRVACHDVAIPIQYWTLLLYNLGRLGRFDELEQLCLEIIQLYTPPYGGLIPVHRLDLPRPSNMSTVVLGTTNPSTASCSEIIVTQCMDEGDMGRTADIEVYSHEPPSIHTKATLEGTGGPFHIKPVSRLPMFQDRCHEPASAKPGSTGSCYRGENDSRQYPVTPAQNEGQAYIPADLPFTHREHPVQKIFNPHLQRSIVRWGFDQTLAARPSVEAVMDMGNSGIVAFDVACGVRLLAVLRDQGVLVDRQILRTAVISRIALSQVPGRRKHRSRDGNETSAESIKRLVDRAWGSELLPSLPDMTRELEAQMPKLWSRYPKLFGRAFDDHDKDQVGIPWS